jgi:hypothetical protein
LKDKKNKSKNIDAEPREYRTRGTRKNQRRRDRNSSKQMLRDMQHDPKRYEYYDD